MRQLLQKYPFWSVLALVLILLFIWYVLPWISIAGVAIFQSLWVRAGLCLVVIAFFIIFHWFRWRKESHKELSLIKDIELYSSGGETSEVEFKKIFTEVFSALNIDGKGKKRLYEIPWYLVIGSPGTGKSTLLRESGLDFVGTKEALEQKGVAGTVLCDWWVSSELVLLDTAGRLTSHDHQENDASDWSILLSKLTKYRPVQPLNGVILTLSVDTLLSSDATESFLHLALKRLEDIHQTLKMRLPIYLFVTKTDLLPGFDACFHQFESAERGKLWGYPVDHKGDSLEELIKTLKNWIYSRQSTLRQDEAQQELVFYQHFSEIAQRVNGFASSITPLLPADIQLRSVFFTSGTQYGNPVEKVFSKVLSGSFGYNLSDLSLRQFPKAYFIKSAFTDVIYNEASFAGQAIHYLQKKKIMTVVLAAVCSLILIGGNFYLWSESNRAEAALLQIEEQFEKLVLEAKHIESLEGGVLLLNNLGHLMDNHIDVSESFVYINNDIRTAIYHAKSETYNAVLIPNLLNKVRDALLNPEVRQINLYANLKAYIIISTGKYFDASFLVNWLKSNPHFAQDASLSEEQNKQLFEYLSEAVTIPREKEYPVDKEAITVARAKLNYIPAGLRLLQALESRKDIPAWDDNLIEMGNNLDKFFARQDGKLMSAALPSGLYSQQGMLWLVQQDVNDMAETYVREGWVLSDSSELKSENSRAIINTMMLDYIINYTRAWQNYFDLIMLRKESDLSRLVIQLEQLSEPESDFSLWLVEIIKQVYLPDDLKSVNKLAGFEILMEKKLDSKYQQLITWSALNKKNTGVARMNQKFMKIKELLDEQLIESSNIKRQFVIRKQFEILVTDLPSPLNSWFGHLSSQAELAIQERADIALNIAWQEKSPECKARLDGRYPFFKKSKADMSLKEFTQLFGQTGLFNDFYHVHSGGSKQLSQSTDFSLSKKISDVYFISGDNPGFDFSVRLKKMSPVIAKLYINIGNDSIEYTEPDGKWLHMRWPLHSAASEVRVKLVDEFDLTIWEKSFYGLWALHRMSEYLSVGRLRNGNFELRKARGEWAFSLELQAPEKNNLLLLKEIRRFRCPEAL